MIYDLQVAEAKDKLPELIEQAEAGARVTITKRGIPVVEIVRKGDAPRKRVFGVFGDKKLPAKVRGILEDPETELLPIPLVRSMLAGYSSSHCIIEIHLIDFLLQLL